MKRAYLVFRLDLPEKLETLDVVFGQRFFLFVPAGTLIVSTVSRPVVQRGAARLRGHRRHLREMTGAPCEAAARRHRRQEYPLFHDQTLVRVKEYSMSYLSAGMPNAYS